MQWTIKMILETGTIAQSPPSMTEEKGKNNLKLLLWSIMKMAVKGMKKGTFMAFMIFKKLLI